MKHTKGPWKLNEQDRTVYIPSGPHSDYAAYGGTLANARLIVAAPDMFEALRALLVYNFYPDSPRAHLEFMSVEERTAFDVIAKVAGKINGNFIGVKPEQEE